MRVAPAEIPRTHSNPLPRRACTQALELSSHVLHLEDRMFDALYKKYDAEITKYWDEQVRARVRVKFRVRVTPLPNSKPSP